MQFEASQMPRSSGASIKFGTLSVVMNVWGNLNGMRGRSRVQDFGTDSYEAADWLNANPPVRVVGNVPAGLVHACQRRQDQIESVEDEGADGYWVYLRDGWIDGESLAHSIHERTGHSAYRKMCYIRRETDAEGAANNSAWWRKQQEARRISFQHVVQATTP